MFYCVMKKNPWNLAIGDVGDSKRRQKVKVFYRGDLYKQEQQHVHISI